RRGILGTTLADVARKREIASGVWRGLLMGQVRDQVDWSQITSLRVLGLDETSLRKGQRDCVTIVSTRDAEGDLVILAVLAGREQETLKVFLHSIPAEWRATLAEVCTDLDDGFAQAVKA